MPATMGVGGRLVGTRFRVLAFRTTSCSDIFVRTEKMTFLLSFQRIRHLPHLRGKFEQRLLLALHRTALDAHDSRSPKVHPSPSPRGRRWYHQHGESFRFLVVAAEYWPHTAYWHMQCAMASGESQAGFVFSKLSRDSGENKNMVEGHRIEQKYTSP